MKTINITGGLIVLLANIYVSFNHSIDLFQLGGFSGSIAYVGVIGAEVTFLLGVLNIVVAKLRGAHPGLPAKAGFGLGVSLILWSNIHAGLDAGITGVILGAVTPVSLIIAEMIIGRAILQPSPKEVETTPTTESEPVQSAPKAPPTLLAAALELYTQSGKVPSRRTIMELTKATEWEARKTIKVLKEEVCNGES